MADASVRPGAANDAGAIGRLQLATWRLAYARLLPPTALEPAVEDQLSARWQSAVAHPPSPRHRVLVALAGDEVVGFAALAPAEDPDLEPMVDAELLALHVDPAHARRGHGSRLLAASVDYLLGDGFRRAYTWVLSTDDATRRFLVSAGWAPDGSARELDPGTGASLAQVRLHTAIDDSAPALG